MIGCVLIEDCLIIFSSYIVYVFLFYFVWNIGERLGWSGVKRAEFAKYCFPVAMKDLEVETIRRTVKQSPENQFTIKIDEPDSKDDYRFHYPNDKIPDSSQPLNESSDY